MDSVIWLSLFPFSFFLNLWKKFGALRSLESTKGGAPITKQSTLTQLKKATPLDSPKSNEMSKGKLFAK